MLAFICLLLFYVFVFLFLCGLGLIFQSTSILVELFLNSKAPSGFLFLRVVKKFFQKKFITTSNGNLNESAQEYGQEKNLLYIDDNNNIQWDFPFHKILHDRKRLQVKKLTNFGFEESKKIEENSNERFENLENSLEQASAELLSPISEEMHEENGRYPKNWFDISKRVRNLDQKRCRVQGCPSTTKLHVHHITPLSIGGSNDEENLITLCAFHHALVPDKGHEMIWKLDLYGERYIWVKGGSRADHIRRIGLVTNEEVESLLRAENARCITQNCNNSNLIVVPSWDNRVRIFCLSCKCRFEAERLLPEETLPALVDFFQLTKTNTRIWKVDWSHHKVFTGGRSASWVAVGNNFAAEKNNLSLICHRCYSRLERKTRRSDGAGFWGCKTYPSCNFTFPMRNQ